MAASLPSWSSRAKLLWMQSKAWRAVAAEWQELDRGSPWAWGGIFGCSAASRKLQGGCWYLCQGRFTGTNLGFAGLKWSLLQQMHGELITAELGSEFCLNPWCALGSWTCRQLFAGDVLAALNSPPAQEGPSSSSQRFLNAPLRPFNLHSENTCSYLPASFFLALWWLNIGPVVKSLSWKERWIRPVSPHGIEFGIIWQNCVLKELRLEKTSMIIKSKLFLGSTFALKIISP